MSTKYIKSPLNYVGGKYKILKDIIPLFPDNINTFVDLFGGGFNVGINVNAKNIIYNDSLSQIVELLDYIHNNDISILLSEIDYYINHYNLSKTNLEGYLQLRESYNNDNETPMKLYTLICYAFSNQIRFNKSKQYNMPFGQRSFNKMLRNKFIVFQKEIQKPKYTFVNKKFNDFDFSSLNDKDLVYCDPPYFNSVATYNENNSWTEIQEKELLNCLDILNKKNIKFALSNNLKYNNPILYEWKNKYNIHYINYNYSNCNYHKKDKNNNDVEVLITNY